jgi:ABC-2 type transport system permease protein
MRNVLSIAGKEFKSYFFSPVAYVVIALFMLIWGWLFVGVVFNLRQADMDILFHNLAFTLFLILSGFTMRLLAEEKRSGTIELLMTSPVTDTQMVLGKYLGCIGFFGVMLVVTLEVPLLLAIYGNPDNGPIIGGYVGFLLLGATFISIGLFMSSLTDNQIVAYVLSFVTCLMLWILNWLSDFMGKTLGDAVKYVSFGERFQDFPKGIIDTRDVIFFLSFIGLFLFLTIRSTESRRWR